MVDIVKALRNRATWETMTGITEPHQHIDWMAANEIERLREALSPFAELYLYPDDMGKHLADMIRSEEDWDEMANENSEEEFMILRSNVRRARAAIRGE